MKHKLNGVIVLILLISIASSAFLYSNSVEAAEKNIINVSVTEMNATNLVQNPTFERSVGNPIDYWNIYFGRYTLTGGDFHDTLGMSEEISPHPNWYFSQNTTNLWIKAPDFVPFGVISYTRQNNGTSTAVAQTISTIAGRRYNFSVQTEMASSKIIDIVPSELKLLAFNGDGVAGPNPIGATEFTEAKRDEPLDLTVDFQAKSSETTVSLRSGYKNYGLDDYTGVLVKDPKVYEYGNDVKVEYINQNGENLAEPEILTGFLDEPYTTEQKDFEGYVIAESPENEMGKFTREDQRVTYIFERQQGAPVFVDYVDTEGNEIADSVILEGDLGATFNTEPKEIYGFTLIEVPSNADGIFTMNSQNVVYVYKISGNLSLEFPEEINFKPVAIETSGVLLTRMEENIGLRIIDSRVSEHQQNWSLQLSLIEEMANEKQQIQGALVYKMGTNIRPLNAGTQEIYKNNSPITEPVEINWQVDEGLLARIPGNKSLPGSYAGKVLWSLIVGP